MATEEEVAQGLIDWVNNLEIAEPVKGIRDFSNGDVLWRLLQTIDRLSFPGDLPEDTKTSDEWSHKWSNLKHLYDALTVFLVEECGQRLPLFTVAGRTRPDLQAIAQHASLPDTILVLKLCVIAAINCADRIAFLMKMQELNTETQNVLMNTAQEAGAGEAEQSEMDEDDNEVTVVDDALASAYVASTGLDTDLASEERLGQVIADNQRITVEKQDLQKQLDDIHDRFESLQRKFGRSQEEVNEANDRLTAVLAGKTDGQGQKAGANSETIIAELEQRAGIAETELEELRKANEVLKIKADRMQKLQDDYDEIKIERDRLSRRANAADKYKQKLESLGDLEKENQDLQAKVSELQVQIRHSDSSQASSSNLQREINEYRRLLPSIEQERYDLNEMKKRLEFDYHTLEARWHDLSEEYTKSQSTVEDLQGRLRDYEDGVGPSTPSKQDQPNHKDLEQEEADFEEAEARLTKALLDSANNTANTSEKGSEAENGISEEELRAIMSAMRAQAQAGSVTEQEKSVRAQKKLLVALDRQRTKNQTLVDHIKKQSDLIQDLRVKATAATEISHPAEETPSEPEPSATPEESASEPTPAPEPDVTPAQKAAAAVPASQHEARLIETIETNDNLRRELRLMTAAWYEQQLRIGAVSSSGSASALSLSMIRSKAGKGFGASEEPRSFLGRQRKIVDHVVLGKPRDIGVGKRR